MAPASGGSGTASTGERTPSVLTSRSRPDTVTPSPWSCGGSVHDDTGCHDGNADTSTLAFLDHPTNPRYPTKWFIRNDPYAAVSFAFAFDEELILPPGDALSLAYRIVLVV